MKMKKIVLILGAVVLSWNGLQGQAGKKDHLLKLIEAEENFSKLSVQKNTREAFLSYLSDDALISRNANLVNGKKVWQEAQADSSELSWHPTFADISSAGDLGYTSGPWEYKKSRKDQKPVAFGHYNTVWKKQSDGSFKAVIDLGISHPGPVQKEGSADLSIKNDKGSKLKNSPNQKDEFFEKERSFIALRDSDKDKAYKKYFSKKAMVYRQGNFPYVASGGGFSLRPDSLEKFQFSFSGGDISASGDLGYVYGTATSPGETGNPGNHQGNYMRIWKKEKGNKWKIVLDVIN